MRKRLLVSLALLSLFTVSIASAATFKTASTITVGNTAGGFVVGDFTSDGNLDVAIVNTNNAQVYVGNGKGNFTPGPTTQTEPDAECIAVGDVNNDGKLDLVVAGANGTNILLGNGNGTFRSARGINNFNINTIAIADFNHDGNADLLLNGITLLLGNGNGTFQTGHDLNSAYSSFPVVVGDFNGDGKMDFAEINDNAVSSVVQVMLGNGDGTFQPPVVTTPPGFGLAGIAAGDFNGDGKLDLAAAVCSDQFCNAAGAADILLGNGDGTFQISEINAAFGLRPKLILTGDFNADGHTDIVEVNNSADFALFTGKGDGTFNPSRSWALPGGAFQGAVGDFNNDGHLDMITLDNQNFDGTVRVLAVVLSGSGPNFQAAPESFMNVPDALAAGDFNEDGKLDLIASNGFDNTGSVAAGQGNGLFIARPSFALLPPNNSASQVLVADFNGDHHLDVIAASNSKVGQLFLSLGNGNGTFHPGVRVNAGFHSGYFTAGDFNGDGILDVAAANFERSGSGDVQVALGNGDGTFQPPIVIAVGAVEPSYLAAGDMNGDGKQDLLVVASGIPSSMFVLLGNGDGTFQPPSPAITLGTYAVQPLLIDLNGDGKLDAVLQMNNSTQNLYVALGNGDGTFQTPQIYTLPGGPAYVSGTAVVADFNGDGHLDIAAPYVTFNGQFGIGLLLGQSNGTFTMGTPVNVVPGTMVGGDFNGDGKPDIVFDNPSANFVAALLNVSP
jgi:FG-GAP-like repeat